jgi:DNA-binding LacI/PurR family transcriptional regulator
MRVAEEEGYFAPATRGSNIDSQIRTYYVLFQQEYTEKGSFLGDLVLSIQRELFIEGVGCSFGVINHDYSAFLKLLNMMRASNTEGILVVGDAPVEHLNILLEAFKKVVFVDYPGDPRLARPCSAVVFNNEFGCYKAVDHLLSLGRRKILLLAGPAEHFFSKIMLSAYRNALADHDIEFDQKLVVSGGFTLEGGYEAVNRKLESGLEFDAVFGTDEMACGAINALRSAGVGVPEDVSVVGFDGLPMGEATRPALTTVALDRELMGKLAVRKLLQTEEDSDESVVTTVLPPKLVIRQSCGGDAEGIVAARDNGSVSSAAYVGAAGR